MTIGDDNEYESGVLSNTDILDSSENRKLSTIKEEESIYLDSAR